MANDNAAKQLSCSWGGGPPNRAAEQIFQQMAAQGQTFFNATGDSDAYTAQIPFPSDSPNVVEVGGTTLNTAAAGGAWSSETTWNWGYDQGSYVGSSGGISTYYALPSWQQGINMSVAQGSSYWRNLPDVALTADNVYVVSDRGQSGAFGGTSCAAPLWAAFTALVNQSAASKGQPPVGFINPALYMIARGSNYQLDFHDIATGNNQTGRSGSRFSAVGGYDLCTGLGTPTGALISALAGPSSTTNQNIVTTSANPANGGTTTGGGAYAAGAQATVTATPNAGYVFTSWTENGIVVSTSASYTFVPTSDRNLIANFTVLTTRYTVSLLVYPSRGGFISGGGTFNPGTACSVSAYPNFGYSFIGWFDNGTLVSTSPSYTFSVVRDRTLLGEFIKRRTHNRRHRDVGVSTDSATGSPER